MRAAPGAVPRAIAQLSRRIDIASNPSTAGRVANNRESRVNPRAVPTLLVAGARGGKDFAAAGPRIRASEGAPHSQSSESAMFLKHLPPAVAGIGRSALPRP